ncbi:MAG: hypothetical protein V8Q84_03315 [Bilophila sp.]
MTGKEVIEANRAALQAFCQVNALMGVRDFPAMPDLRVDNGRDHRIQPHAFCRAVHHHLASRLWHQYGGLLPQ